MDKTIYNSRWRFASKVAGYHFLLSLLIAAATAWLVFRVWYPAPYDVLVGGLNLYGLVVAVDVICGPLLTLVLANPRKSKRETTLDLGLVALIQLAALVYGLNAVAAARPVVVAFETDRFTVVSAAEIDKAKLQEAPKELQNLPWNGVRRIAVREPKNNDEKLASLEMSLQGVEPSARPDWWLSDSKEERMKVREKMQPVAKLLERYPDNADLRSAIAKSKVPAQQLYFLPFTGQKNKDWTVLLNQHAEFKEFVELDSF